jgi:hypothetical protein
MTYRSNEREEDRRRVMLLLPKQAVKERESLCDVSW